MKKQFFLIIALLLAITPTLVGQSVLDSLKKELRKKQTLEEKAETLKNLYTEYSYENTDSARAILNRYSSLAHTSQNQKLIGNAYLMEGNWYYDRSSYDSAEYFTRKSLALSDSTDYTILARIYLNLGSVFDAKGLKDSAIVNYLNSIGYFKKINEPKNVAYLKINIGLVFKSLGQYKKAEKYYREAYSYLHSIENRFGIASVATNLASLFVETNTYDSALAYAFIGKKTYEELGYPVYSIYPLEVLGRAYLGKKDYKKAEQALLKTHTLSNQYQMMEEAVSAAKDLANLYLTMRQYKKADSFSKIALDQALEIGGLEDKRDAYQIRANVLSSVNRPSEAFKHLVNYQTFKDSVEQKERLEMVNELETKYRTTEQQLQLAQNTLDIERKDNELNQARLRSTLLIIGLVSLFLAGLLIYLQLRRNHQLGLQKAVILEKEKGLESLMYATEEERKRISKDLHDGIGQQLSALKLALGGLKNRVGEPEAKYILEGITSQFSHSVEEVRQISHQMMPKVLMEQGLLAAVQELLRSTFSYTDFQYEFGHHNLFKRYPEKIEVSVYRILQELINNAIKHSKGSELQVQLMQIDQQLILMVEDNGIGFSGQKSTGHGLHNIRTRLDLVGGLLHYEQGPDGGTLATVRVPTGKGE